MQYLIENGASGRADFSVERTVLGLHFYSGAIKSACDKYGVLVRRFARANADIAREILQNNGDLATKRARKLGIDEKLQEFTFDFSDACSGLTSDKVATLRNLRYALTSGKPKFQVITDATPTRRGSVPGSSGNNFGDSWQ
jgi:hypothetical protein